MQVLMLSWQQFAYIHVYIKIICTRIKVLFKKKNNNNIQEILILIHGSAVHLVSAIKMHSVAVT